MAKITITIEGDIGDLVPVLAKIGELRKAQLSDATAVIVSGEAEWTEERVLEVWKALTENCKRVLAEVASTEDMTWKQLQDKLAWSPRKIGGSVSSLGAQLRNHSLRGITYPLVENEAGGYNLLPVWRDTVLKQLQRGRRTHQSPGKQA